MPETKPDADEDCANWCITPRLVCLIFIETLLILLYQSPLLKKDES